MKGEETGVLFNAVITKLAKNTQENTNQDFWVDIRGHAKALYQGANLLQENTRFTDKSLENIFLVEIILSLYPKAKIIYCDRHPLASVVSILKNNMVTLPWAHDVNNILEYVDNCLTAIAKWTELYPESIYRITYENLVTEPEVESKKLMAFCGLKWSESCLTFHKNKDLMNKTASHIQVRDKINQSALNTYQKYAPYFREYTLQYPWLKIE